MSRPGTGSRSLRAPASGAVPRASPAPRARGSASASTARRARAGSRPAARSSGCTATPRCSSAACARCMLQSLHPAAMTAVAEHSGFRGDMWGRLARTSTLPRRRRRSAPPRTRRQAVDAVRRDPRPDQRHAARRDAVRRLRPAPAASGCTSPRSTASCSPTRSTAPRRSTRPAATSTSPRRPSWPASSASSTRRATEAELRAALGGVPARAARHRARPRGGRASWSGTRTLPWAARPAYLVARGGRGRADARGGAGASCGSPGCRSPSARSSARWGTPRPARSVGRCRPPDAGHVAHGCAHLCAQPFPVSRRHHPAGDPPDGPPLDRDPRRLSPVEERRRAAMTPPTPAEQHGTGAVSSLTATRRVRGCSRGCASTSTRSS